MHLHQQMTNTYPSRRMNKKLKLFESKLTKIEKDVHHIKMMRTKMRIQRENTIDLNKWQDIDLKKHQDDLAFKTIMVMIWSFVILCVSLFICY
jgi:hypothetical protein